MQERKILKNKLYLYITEFFAGMSVMAVELGASRLLAPYFSSSQIVWTIIIGTIMIAMALGNIYGGRTADKNPNPDRLYGRIIIAAIWIGLIPVAGKYIIMGISALLIFTISTNYLIIAAFAACMVVFVFPLFLLGTVTPSLVKYTIDSLDDSGKVVGTLNASNTIGSIIGTFVPTFISIPAVGTSITFLIFSGILLALAIVYFVSEKIKTVKVPVATVIFILCCIFGHNNSFAFWEEDLRVEDESIYNYLQVSETDSSIILSTNAIFGVQSIYKKEKALTGMYYDYAMAAPYMAGIYKKNRPLKVLILGMGTGTYATQCRRYFGDMYIEGVEIDQKITDLAHEYFDLPEDIKVTTYDGRAYLAALKTEDDSREGDFSEEQAMSQFYDVIMVDAYQDITIPFQMSSVEFFALVKQQLNPGGVMVVNMNMKTEVAGGINEYLSDTIASVFSEVYTVDVAGNTNRELFASDNPDMMKEFNLSLGKEENEELKGMMNRIGPDIKKYTAGSHIMTDDKAPVEVLSMKAIDELLGEEVSYYKDIYKEKGIKGLIEAF